MRNSKELIPATNWVSKEKTEAALFKNLSRTSFIVIPLWPGMMIANTAFILLAAVEEHSTVTAECFHGLWKNWMERVDHPFVYVLNKLHLSVAFVDKKRFQEKSYLKYHTTVQIQHQSYFIVDYLSSSYHQLLKNQIHDCLS